MSELEHYYPPMWRELNEVKVIINSTEDNETGYDAAKEAAKQIWMASLYEDDPMKWIDALGIPVGSIPNEPIVWGEAWDIVKFVTKPKPKTMAELGDSVLIPDVRVIRDLSKMKITLKIPRLTPRPAPSDPSKMIDPTLYWIPVWEWWLKQVLPIEMTGVVEIVDNI